MNLAALLGVTVVLAAIGWLLWSLNRLSLAWTAAQNRINELDQRRVDLVRCLMKIGGELIQLKQDEKESADKLAAVRAQVAARQKELGAFVPPPPREIFINSEYPSARGDKPWLIALARNPGAPAAAAKQYLVWAGDHAGALNRARYVLADESGYEIVSAQRFN